MEKAKTFNIKFMSRTAACVVGEIEFIAQYDDYVVSFHEYMPNISDETRAVLKT